MWQYLAMSLGQVLAHCSPQIGFRLYLDHHLVLEHKPGSKEPYRKLIHQSSCYSLQLLLEITLLPMACLLVHIRTQSPRLALRTCAVMSAARSGIAAIESDRI